MRHFFPNVSQFGERATFSQGVRLLRRKTCCNPRIAALYKTVHFQELWRTCKEDSALSQITTRLQEKLSTGKQACSVCKCSSQPTPLPHTSRILQSDNGREFVNKVIEELLKSWYTDIQLASGRSHHPQSQGLVKRAHYTLQRKLSAENNRFNAKFPPWSQWLPRINCKLREHTTFL